jgi:hypothetical protein
MQPARVGLGGGSVAARLVRGVMDARQPHRAIKGSERLEKGLPAAAAAVRRLLPEFSGLARASQRTYNKSGPAQRASC